MILTIMKHANGAAERRARFYPARATRDRDYAEHARNPNSFRVREPDFCNAVHRRARAERFSRPPCPQSPGFDYSSHESEDHRYSDLRADPGRDVGVDRADYRGPRLARYALGQCFKKSRKVRLACPWRLDDRRSHCRWRHRDSGGQQGGAQRRYRGGVNRRRNDFEALRSRAWPALFESGKPAVPKFDSCARVEDSRRDGVVDPQTRAAEKALRRKFDARS